MQRLRPTARRRPGGGLAPVGIVLAGGRSRRMGSDKACLPFSSRGIGTAPAAVAPGDGGESASGRSDSAGLAAAGGRSGLSEREGESDAAAMLFDRVARRLEAVASRVIVVGKDLSLADRTRFEVVPDCRSEQAALVGILSGLRAAGADWSFIVACDMPFISTGLLVRLHQEALATGRPVAVPASDRGPEPLHGVWHRSVIGVIERRLAEGRFDLMALLGVVEASCLSAKECLRIDPTGRFALNVNTPGDYRSAVEMLFASQDGGDSPAPGECRPPAGNGPLKPLERNIERRASS